MKEALFLTVLSLLVTQSTLKPTRELEIWESPCGSSNVSLNLDLFLAPTEPPQIDNDRMLRACVVVFREARAAINDAKDIFKKDNLLSNEEALLIKDTNGSAVGLDFHVSPRSENVVVDINSDYSLVSAAILYIEDIKSRGRSTQIYSHVYVKILTLFRKLQSILCTFQNMMGLNRADITSYISRTDYNLPTGDVADLVESDYLALIQISKLMTDLINKYS
uniref:Uncharacterized protein LOC111128353 n=1 Tax=Crassostrea virginica TaxID=6565 RepID=A0A8B8DRM7_CRAVI|nr:uncharacterized protein LOC111128353 [Crassostrea virginica]